MAVGWLKKISDFAKILGDFTVVPAWKGARWTGYNIVFPVSK